MKRILISALALSMLAGAAGTAAAQPFGHDGRGGYAGHMGDHQDWRRGGRINGSDWGRGHVIDYRVNHLRRPPHGYQWREVDGRYVLAAVATGLIADIIINSR